MSVLNGVRHAPCTTHLIWHLSTAIPIYKEKNSIKSSNSRKNHSLHVLWGTNLNKREIKRSINFKTLTLSYLCGDCYEKNLYMYLQIRCCYDLLWLTLTYWLHRFSRLIQFVPGVIENMTIVSLHDWFIEPIWCKFDKKMRAQIKRGPMFKTLLKWNRFSKSLSVNWLIQWANLSARQITA